MLNSISSLSDASLNERDRRIVRRFPSLFWMEVLLNQNLDEILDQVYVKQDPSYSPETERRNKLKQLDASIVQILDELEKVSKINNKYAAKMFASLLMRSFLNQVLSDGEAIDMVLNFVLFTFISDF